MTTVAYDGKTIAADSRITTHNKRHTCIKCNTTDKARLDESIKIVLARGKTFRGEKILGIGRAGSVSVTQDLIKVIRTGVDIEVAYKHFRMFGVELSGSSHLLIVTDKSVFHITVDDEPEMKIERFERDVKIAIGHGRMGALVAMNSMGKSAADAIIEVSKFDDSTGGPVNIMDFSEEEPKVKPYDPNAVPVKKKPGRKPGSTNKPKEAAPVKPAARKAAAKPAAKPAAKAPVKRATAKNDNQHAKAA